MTANNEDFKGRIKAQEKVRTGTPMSLNQKLMANKPRVKNVIQGIPEEGEILSSTLICPVNDTVFHDVLNKGLNFIIWDESPWATSRLYQNKFYNKVKTYQTIELYINIRKMKHSILCEFEGFFIAQSTHEVTYEEVKQFVMKDSYILKIGKILKIS